MITFENEPEYYDFDGGNSKHKVGDIVPVMLVC